jgi:hypothetical protein
MHRTSILLLTLAWWAISGPIWAQTTSATANLSINVTQSQTITGVSLSNTSFQGGAASGTVVGTISVAMSPTTPAFSGTLSLGGANASSFQIVGSNLETNGTVPAGSYQLSIVAVENGAAGSPFTQAETITGTGAGTVGCPMGSSYADGCAGSTGSHQFAGLFAPYPAVSGCTVTDPTTGLQCRPPWNVAGFDYPVGIAPGTTLTPIASYSQANISVSSTTCNTSYTCYSVSCSGSGSVTINAVDFTNAYISPGGCNLTITNSKIACNLGGIAQNYVWMASGSGNVTIKNNDFILDGCGTTNSNDLTTPVQGTSGTLTLEYNFIENQPETIVSALCGPLTYMYNLIHNPNPVSGAHENLLQNACGSGGTQTGLDIEFNTYYGNLTFTEGGSAGEGFQMTGCCGQIFTVSNPLVSSNTMIARPVSGNPDGVSMSNMIHGYCHVSGDCSTTAVPVSGTAYFNNNYFDPSGAFGIWYGQGSGAPMWPSQVSATGNINMTTGATTHP